MYQNQQKPSFNFKGGTEAAHEYELMLLIGGIRVFTIQMRNE